MPDAALLPEAIFNYDLTVEKYLLLLLRERCQKIVKEPGNCERAQKSAQNYANDFFFHSCVQIFHFLFMRCRERTCVKERTKTYPSNLRNDLAIIVTTRFQCRPMQLFT